MSTLEIELAVLIVAVVAASAFGLSIHSRMLGEILERQAVMGRYVKNCCAGCCAGCGCC